MTLYKHEHLGSAKLDSYRAICVKLCLTLPVVWHATCQGDERMIDIYIIELCLHSTNRHHATADASVHALLQNTMLSQSHLKLMIARDTQEKDVP